MFIDKNKVNSRLKFFKILSYVNCVYVYFKWYCLFYCFVLIIKDIYFILKK